MEDKLPDLPSALLQCALNDLKKCEQDSRYTIDMGHWHDPKLGLGLGLCYVCLAGAALAKTCKVSPEICYDIRFDNLKLNRKLLALDCFRVGSIGWGLNKLGYNLPEGMEDYTHIAPYEDNRELFFIDLKRLVEELRSNGL